MNNIKLQTSNNNKENIEVNGKRYTYSIITPGGNSTALVESSDISTLSKDDKLSINSTIIKNNLDVEQVGFISTDLDNPCLEMAGGEFCGNATRAATWWYYKEYREKISSIKVSGVEDNIEVSIDKEIDKNGDKSYISGAEMPIYNDIKNIIKVDNTTYIVKMQGITQIVTNDIFSDNDNNESIKNEAMKLIKYYEKKYPELEESPCIGVMYTDKSGEKKEIKPIVFVREINTLFYETACGSGTCAVGLVDSFEKQSSTNLDILQPSGNIISIDVSFNGKNFTKAYIKGPAESTDSVISDLISQTVKLYIEIFAEEPYFEEFSFDEIKNIIEDSIEKGGEWLIKQDDKGNVIAFIASLPFENTDEVSEEVKNQISAKLGEEDTIYMSEIGVINNIRRKKVATKLIESLIDKNKTIILRTNKNNTRGIALYEKVGFEKLDIEDSILKDSVSGGKIKQDKVFLVYNSDKLGKIK